jgi:hypothetical protein
MAKRERIGFYGRFTPAPVDMSQANKFKQLAGIAEDVGGLALSQAKRIREEQAVEEGAIAGVKAAETGELELSSTFGFGGATRNKAAINSFMAESEAKFIEQVDDLEIEFADDPLGFAEASNNLIEGLSKSVPIPVQQQQEEFVRNIIGLSNKRISKSYLAKQEIQTKTKLELASDELFKKVESAALVQDDAAVSVFFGNLARNYQDLLESKGITPAQYANNMAKVVDAIAENNAIGAMDDLLNNQSLTDQDGNPLSPQQRVALAEQSIKDISKDRDIVIVDPSDNTKKISITQDKKKNIIATLKANVNEYKQVQLDQERRQDFENQIRQAENYDAALLIAQDTKVPVDERMLTIKSQAANRQISDTDARLLVSMMTAESKINVLDNREDLNDRYSQMYGLLFDYNNSEITASEFTQGIEDLKRFIAVDVADGKYKFSSGNALLNSIRSTTSKNVAEATREAEAFQANYNEFQNSGIPKIYIGTAMQRLMSEANNNTRLQSLINDNLDGKNDTEINDIKQQLAIKVSNEVRNEYLEEQKRATALFLNTQ